MSRASEVFVLAALFVLRLGVPVAFTLAVCFVLKRLDRRWEADAQLHPTPVNADTDIAPEKAKALPCWLIKGCSSDRYQNCAAYENRSLPCWLARLRVEGRIPQACANCSLFRTPTGTHA